MKKVVWLIAGVTLLAAAAYSFLSLYRWEWTRALYFGLVALVAEIGLATALVMRKLDQTHGNGGDHNEQEHLRTVLHEQRTPHSPFAWLKPREVMSRPNVFITMLVGGGIILSGLAWVLDKVAANTSSALQERRIAGELSRISYPEHGLLPDDVTVLAQELPHLDDPQLRYLLGRR